MKKQLTYKSKDVWDEILRHSIPIEMDGMIIPRDYMLQLLKGAIGSGLISTATRSWCDLYWCRDYLPVYISECEFTNLLYRMDVPVYYESAKLCGNRKFKFYAKIKQQRDKLNSFILNGIDKYIDSWYHAYKERDYRKLYTIGRESK